MDHDVHDAIDSGLAFLTSLQRPDGTWPGSYGGPGFLMPMYVAACRVLGHEPDPDRRRGIVRHLLHVQNPDGGVGLHFEDEGSMFTTTLSYAALRILGVPRDDPAVTRMRSWVRANGTALGAASWGKLVLAVLNLYPYEGLPPILPELWLLPRSAPIHPRRLWCHARLVYLPMAYLYATRSRVAEDPLVTELREDLYDRPYDSIDFAAHRHTVAPSDARFPATRAFRVASGLLSAFERACPDRLRRRALEEVMEQIRHEDRSSRYIDIGPVNSVLNTIVHHFREPGGEEERKSFEALEAYVQEQSDGIHFNGYNSTALWDAAFAVQAIVATGRTERYADVLRRASAFIRDNQILEDVPDGERHHRHPTRGGWPFSDRAHGWPVADCTAEGFKSAVALERVAEEPVEDDRLRDAIRLILAFRNPDGGWPTYERQRAGAWLEAFNPSQVFGGIMVDYSHPECTSACLQALAHARTRLPGFLVRDVDRAVREGVRYLRRTQKPDGSWQGSWGVCFTYGTWFAVSGLRAAGTPCDAPEIAKACGFLLQRQNADGGWGEHRSSCVEGRYVRDERSRVAQTAWALMTLVRSGLADTAAARRAAAFLAGAQRPDGDWPEEPMVGVFNRSVLIDYPNYRRYFPIWALAEYEEATAVARTGTESRSAAVDAEYSRRCSRMPSNENRPAPARDAPRSQEPSSAMRALHERNSR